MPNHGERMRAACMRACDAHGSVTRVCDRINEELDEVTSPGAVQVGGLREDDSMVTTVAAVLASAPKAANGAGG